MLRKLGPVLAAFLLGLILAELLARGLLSSSPAIQLRVGTLGAVLVLHGVPTPLLDEAYVAYRWTPRLYTTAELALDKLAPTFSEYGGTAGATPTFHEACADQDTECVDVQPRFTEALHAGSLGSGQWHWNAAGNRLVADALLAHLAAHPGTAAATRRGSAKG